MLKNKKKKFFKIIKNLKSKRKNAKKTIKINKKNPKNNYSLISLSLNHLKTSLIAQEQVYSCKI